jgi:hypothetical protein
MKERVCATHNNEFICNEIILSELLVFRHVGAAGGGGGTPSMT